jgi:hypothetical protein
MGSYQAAISNNPRFRLKVRPYGNVSLPDGLAVIRTSRAITPRKRQFGLFTPACGAAMVEA